MEILDLQEVKEMRTNGCPNCGKKIKQKEIKPASVVECQYCEAIYTISPISLGESYEYVLPYMEDAHIVPEKERYFDFECLSSKGKVRRHGWYNPVTNKITQVG